MGFPTRRITFLFVLFMPGSIPCPSPFLTGFDLFWGDQSLFGRH